MYDFSYRILAFHCLYVFCLLPLFLFSIVIFPILFAKEYLSYNYMVNKFVFGDHKIKFTLSFYIFSIHRPYFFEYIICIKKLEMSFTSSFNTLCPLSLLASLISHRIDCYKIPSLTNTLPWYCYRVVLFSVQKTM